MALLLLADPSEEKLRSYLPASRCFVASCNGGVVGACVIQHLGSSAHELMCVAVDPAHQRSGYGHALLKHVVDQFRESGARTPARVPVPVPVRVRASRRPPTRIRPS